MSIQLLLNFARIVVQEQLAVGASPESGKIPHDIGIVKRNLFRKLSAAVSSMREDSQSVIE